MANDERKSGRGWEDYGGETKARGKLEEGSGSSGRRVEAQNKDRARLWDVNEIYHPKVIGTSRTEWPPELAPPFTQKARAMHNRPVCNCDRQARAALVCVLYTTFYT
jgi:hypothetical protein